MTILCVGDIHIKPTNTHLIDCLETQLLQRITDEEVHMVIFLGDVLDTFERLHTQALNRAYQLIHAVRARCQLFILVGNHDLINNQQFLTSEHWMNALKHWENVTIVDQVITQLDQMGCGRLFFVPYVPVQTFVRALDTCTEASWKDADYIFAHQEFQGCKMGAVASVHGDEWPLTAPMIISGHIHDYQQPQPNLLYIGASVQNSFGDQTSPRFLCIGGKERIWREIAISLPRKKTVYSTLDEIRELDCSTWVSDPNVDTVRIVVRGDYEQFKTYVKSEHFEKLKATQKCKVVHKPIDTKEEKKEELDLDCTSFHSLLLSRVLEQKNEQLYVAYHRAALGDESLHVEDILIV